MTESKRWYHGVTRYQWLVLIIASLGWVFDVFEGQIFVASMNEAMPALAPAGSTRQDLQFYNNIALAAFLLGGAVGGVAFGALSDRIGRKRTMTYTIVMYSAFTCLSAFSQSWWHMVVFRFLVAMGVGGEWAVASALVAEVFPPRARAWSLAIFHASSVLGTLLAVLAGLFLVGAGDVTMELPGFATWVVGGWRLGFLVGVLPALLIIWIRLSLRESPGWRQAREQETAKLGRVGDLFHRDLRRRVLVGVGLAAVGLATFWGTHIYGKDTLRQAAVRQGRENPKTAEMLGMFLVTTGGGLGLAAFGPICERVGRKKAFLVYQLGGCGASMLLFLVLAPNPLGTEPALVAFLPVFGFLTLGMHAGYAVYFPELFPTRLRGTGAGFCFNIGRVVAAPVLVLSGWMQKDWGYSLDHAAALLSGLFLLGVLLLPLAPETRGKPLPE